MFAALFGAACFGQSPQEPPQTWSFGIIGGGALTDPVYNIVQGAPGIFHGRSFSGSHDWIAGLTIEHPLFAGLSVEAQAEYRELHQSVEGIENNGEPNSVSPAPIVTYEFPVLAKYRLHRGRFEPFLEGGPSFRTTGNLNGVFPSHYGATAGVGVAFRLANFEFAPVLRYTRWQADAQAYFGVAKQDQVEVLLGISRRMNRGDSTRAPRFAMGLAVGTGLGSDYRTLNGVPTTTFAIVNNVIVAVPATVDQSGSASAIAGLATEFALPLRLYAEFDALHHPLCVTQSTTSSLGFTYTRTGCGVTWEVPLMVKYKFGSGRLKPLLAAGPSARTGQGIGNVGAAGAVGLEIRAGSLRIAPTVRYTRWSGNGVVVTRNQVEFITEFLL